MKLISCHIENYGALTNYDVRFNCELTEFFWGNGVGKTTLCSFIKAMFYGLPSATARSKFNERQHYYPFSGGKFGGNITFEKEGRECRIERFFDKGSPSKDTCRFFISGSPVEENDVGRAVFGVDEDSFLRTAFISSDEVEMSATASISTKLNDVLTGSEAGYEGAAAALDRAVKSLKASKGEGGEIGKLGAKIRGLQAEVANLAQIERGLGERYARRKELEKSEVPQLGAAPSRTPLILAAISILFVLGGIITLFFSTVGGIIIAVIGVVGLIGAGFLYLKPRDAKPAVGADIQRELIRLDGIIEEEERQIELLSKKRAELEEAEARLKELNERYFILSAAKGFLDTAERNLKVKYLVPVKDSFCNYTALLERTLGEKISMDKDFRLFFERGGEMRGDGHLSAGQRAVCMLCFRLALIDNMYGDEQPFIILDDPFVSLDADHLLRAFKLLKDLSKGRQLIYFCCHASRLPSAN